ncbi:MAG: peroxiredoxin [Gemmatimonadetes bacterium]|nr:peroxiredoxin [Gemmatimonadota bacterium]
MASKRLVVRLPADDGSTFDLAEHHGSFVVLFFFPKAGSPGCTESACEFRDLMPRFARVGAEVAGVSPDSVRKLANFRNKLGLPYRLLSDPDAAVIRRFKLWVPKQLFGHRYMGVDRASVVIGPDGRVAATIKAPVIAGHADAVLLAVRDLRALA